MTFFVHVSPSTEIYTLSLHDALPIYLRRLASPARLVCAISACTATPRCTALAIARSDRKSTRLNSSHSSTSYAGYCLKKKSKGGGPDDPGGNATSAKRPGRRPACGAG